MLPPIWGDQVPYYRLYSRNEIGRFSKLDEIDAPNDACAVELALGLRDGRAAELWNEKRFVQSFDAAPLLMEPDVCGRATSAP